MLIIKKIRSLLLERNKINEEALIEHLQDSVLVVNCQFGTYVDKMGLDIGSIIERNVFKESMALATSDCPETVINAVSVKMPVIGIKPGTSFGNSIREVFDIEGETGLTVLGRISPYIREWFTSQGIKVITLELGEDNSSSTNLSAGIIDVREILCKYPGVAK